MAGYVEGLRRVYAGTARNYDERWREYLDVTVSRTLAAVPAAVPGPLLDVGCGSGLLLERLLARDPTRRVVGVDLSPQMLEVARARIGDAAPLMIADAAALPFHDASFGLVVTSSSVHQWADPDAGLREIARVLAPGGTLVLTDWRADHLPTRLRGIVLRMTDPSHGHPLSVRRARAALRAAGFQVVTVERYTAGWSWGLMTITAGSRA